MSDLRDRMIPLRAAVDAATEAAIGAMTRDLAPTQRGAPLTSLARSCSEGGKRFRGILAHVGHCLARGGPLDEAPQALTGGLGQIVTSIFYGETVEYEIETESGSLVCVVSDPREDEILAEGQVVRIGIEAEKAWLLESGETASA